MATCLWGRVEHNNNFIKQNCVDTLVGVVILMSDTVIWHFRTHGSHVVSIQVFPKNFKIFNNLCIGFFA